MEKKGKEKKKGGEETMNREALIEKERKQLEETEKEMIKRREREREEGRVVSDRQKQVVIDFLGRVFEEKSEKVVKLTPSNFSSVLCDGLSMCFFPFFSFFL